MNIKNFLEDTKTEFRHINWPSKKEGWRLTLIVILFSIGISLFLAIFDNTFIFLLKRFILGL
ncbi:MAG: preprotein translocase subunit SecE [bacterium]|nr:preprotein translocase subunit SecE [Patescibacteria group bacterium]MDW8279833.1 preprotein translocase subunit SecE [bacterium]